MSANLTILAVDNPAYTHGFVWHRLHSEREEICEALLKESEPSYENLGAKLTSNEGVMNAVNWHRELLQARLKKVDDALDRLM